MPGIGAKVNSIFQEIEHEIEMVSVELTDDTHLVNVNDDVFHKSFQLIYTVFLIFSVYVIGVLEGVIMKAVINFSDDSFDRFLGSIDSPY